MSVAMQSRLLDPWWKSIFTFQLGRQSSTRHVRIVTDLEVFTSARASHCMKAQLGCTRQGLSSRCPPKRPSSRVC